MIADALKKALLQAAIQGKLTEQLPEDGDARDLLKEIQKEKARLIKEGKIKKEKPLPVIKEDEIPFDIPENWVWVRLGELGDYRKGPFGSSLTKSMFIPDSSNAIKVYEQKNAIQKNEKLGEYFINQEYYRKKMRGFTVEGGDIIISCAGTIGESYILPDTSRRGIINQALMRVRTFTGIEKKYYLHAFNYTLSAVGSKGKGSAIKNIPPFKILKELLVPLPPLKEQQHIVDKLDQAMLDLDQLADEEAKLDNLEKAFPSKIRASILQAAIQGKLTEQLPEDGDARDLLKEIQKEKARLVKEGKIKKEKPLPEIKEEEIPFDIPECWAWVRLGEFSKIINGFTPLRSNLDFWDSPDIPWFTVKDIRDQGHFIDHTQEYISKAAINGSERIVQANSVLLCCTASIGEFAYTYIDLTTNQQFNGITVNPLYERFITPMYIYYYVQTITERLLTEAGKTTFPFLSTKKLANFAVPVAPLTEQKRIVEKVEELLPLCTSLETTTY